MTRLKLFAAAGLCALGAAAAQPAVAAGKSGHCPPGLAKKAVPCVPPGQAKKGLVYDHDHDRDVVIRYELGDRILTDYTRLRYPDRYGLDRSNTYYRVGDYLYRVDPETKQVLDLVGLVAQVLN